MIERARRTGRHVGIHFHTQEATKRPARPVLNRSVRALFFHQYTNSTKIERIVRSYADDRPRAKQWWSLVRDRYRRLNNDNSLIVVAPAIHAGTE